MFIESNPKKFLVAYYAYTVLKHELCISKFNNIVYF